MSTCQKPSTAALILATYNEKTKADGNRYNYNYDGHYMCVCVYGIHAGDSTLTHISYDYNNIVYNLEMLFFPTPPAHDALIVS